MRTKGALSLSAFAIILVAGFAFFASMGVKLRPPPQRTYIAMQIPDINGLVVGSSVQLRGVPIGEISSINTTISGATVDFYIDSRYKIPVDSDIRLSNLSALGESYILVMPRSLGGPILKDGERIATEAITQPPSISELTTSVVRVLNQFDPAALERIINETDAGLPKPTEALPNLARTSRLLRDTASSMNGKGRDLLDNFQTLFRNADFVGPVLAFNAPYITEIGRDFNWVFDTTTKLYQHGGPQTVNNFAKFVGRAENLLGHSSGDIKVLTQSMLPYVNDISGALMNLDTGRIFTSLLAGVPEDGAITLHVTIPDAGAPAEPAAAVPPAPAPEGGARAAADAPAPTTAPAAPGN